MENLAIATIGEQKMPQGKNGQGNPNNENHEKPKNIYRANKGRTQTNY